MKRPTCLWSPDCGFSVRVKQKGIFPVGDLREVTVHPGGERTGCGVSAGPEVDGN